MSKKEHLKIFVFLKKGLFLDKVAEENPIVMFVVRQPGSVKTTFIQNTDFSKYNNKLIISF